MNLVITHIAEKWPLIASQVTGRTDQQCRDRWFHHLKPLAMQKHYSKQEDRIMLIAHMKLGNCWSTLSKAFYGNRSSTSLVQRFHGPVKRSIETHLKKKPTYVGVSEDGRYPLCEYFYISFCFISTTGQFFLNIVVIHGINTE